MNFFLVSAGGVIGVVTRYICGMLLSDIRLFKLVSIATICINMFGSLGLGLFLGLYQQYESSNEVMYLTIAVGFFSSFTTFSTFSMESFEYLRRGLWKEAITYIMMTISGSIIFFIIGFYIMKYV